MRPPIALMLVTAALAAGRPEARGQDQGQVLTPGARPTLLRETGAGEGPAWHPQLGLLTSGDGHINRLARDGSTEVYRRDAGSNGILFDTQGRLVYCDAVGKRVNRVGPDGGLTVLADGYDGHRFNQPNDLTVDSKGRIYFTDPCYGDRSAMEMVDAEGRKVEGVYRIDPDGKVSRIITHEVDRPNGIAVTPDDRFLYVADNNNDTVGGARKLWRFALRPDGTVEPGSRTLLHDWGTTRGPDGIKLDVEGRLYVAAGLNVPNPPAEVQDLPTAGVYVFTPEGELIERIPIPRDECTNCAFGGDDLKTLYVTAGGTLWSVSVRVPGRPAWPTPIQNDPPPEALKPEEAALVTALLRDARAQGDPARGAAVFGSPKLACVSCHKVGKVGGAVGPELTAAGLCLPPEQLVESILWPRRVVKGGYEAVAVSTVDGRLIRGYRLEETGETLALRDPSTGERVELRKAEVEESREEGSMMPEGLHALMTPAEQRDLVRFLLDLGRPGGISADAVPVHPHGPATFAYENGPVRPDARPDRDHPVNRDRIYDFYAKEATAFLDRPGETLLPQFPGLDGGRDGHWGNQSEATWADARWNDADLGTLLSGVFRGAGVTVPKGVCVRLGETGEMAVCFNPETLTYDALWEGGFVKFSATRHGFLDGLILDGKPLPRPEGTPPAGPFKYHGFYRHGKRVVFAYRVGDVEMLDAPWAEGGVFRRVVGPAEGHPLAPLTRGGPRQWPQSFPSKGTTGKGAPYVVDTIEPPFDNPWKAPLFFGDHDFLPDGSAVLCTMQGDVWRVDGIDAELKNVRWRRVASGLHQGLGLVVADGRPHVLGRDQITRLHDLNGDGEADFYECVSNAYRTSAAGHDFVAGLQRDGQGRWYTASGPQGVIRISADGGRVETLASGLRNPDGLGLGPDGTLTVPNSEGDWVPASMVCEVKPGASFGYKGPKGGGPPDLPLVYLPRGLDNSSGGQVFVESDRFGPLGGHWVHLSFGQGTAFLMLRGVVDGQPQGAVVPLDVEFRSGAHRGRVNPKDGQLYVSGMAGWGSYTTADGSFQRVRYTGGPAQLPVGFQAHQNGVTLEFSSPVDPAVAGRAAGQFAQAWNYKYGPAYGSSEWSTRHPGVTGHDRLAVRSSHVLDDGKSLFLEIPDLQPVNQLHLHVRTEDGPTHDVFATVHRLGPPFTGFPGYRPVEKTVAAHPILADMVALTVKPVPNPHRGRLAGSRLVTVEAGKNLSFTPRTIRAEPGEPIRLSFSNPDVVPHNWVLIRAGALPAFGNLVNKMVAAPDAAIRHYVPGSDDLIAYTDIVLPGEQFSIEFKAPDRPGRYPFLCTFPGHWMVMNGELIVD